MTPPVRTRLTLALVVLTAACSSPSPTGPMPVAAAPPPTATVATLTGTWTGLANDSQGPTHVTWALTQSGDSVAGTVKTQAVDPADGSCGSCHRNKSGTFTGTISGGTVHLTMFFAAGVDGDPTPACTATLTGLASAATADRLSALYSGSDSCEGAFENGTLAMDRQR